MPSLVVQRPLAGPLGLRPCSVPLPAVRSRLAPRRRQLELRVAQIERQDVLRAEKPTAALDNLEKPQQLRIVPERIEDLQMVSDIWARNAAMYGDFLAVHDPHAEGSPRMTFRQLHEAMLDVGAGLRELGLRPGDKVCLFAENSARWLVADGAIMAAGGADVVRGAAAPPEELLYITQHSGAVGAVLADGALLDRLLAAAQDHDTNPLAALSFVVLLSGEPTPAHAAALPCPVLSYSALAARGGAVRRATPGGFVPAARGRDDVATLVYTSGTTGHPKGVVLTHGNLLYQVSSLPHFLAVQPGERVLSLLPPWHIYERTCAYFVLSRGGHQVYTNIRRLRDDLAAHPPDHFVCVPLVLDTLHGRVMQRLRASGSALRTALALGLLAAAVQHVRACRVVAGTAVRHALPVRGGLAGLAARWLAVAAAAVAAAVLAPLRALANKLVFGKIREALGIRKTVISGGGSLAAHLDDFYEAVGLPVLNGWGLTETSPVLACRRAAPPGQNIRGSVGVPTPGTQLRVVDPETLAPLPHGSVGLLLAKGPGVFGAGPGGEGYHGDPAATARAFRAGEGWFDTGDLGWVAPEGVPGSAMAGHVVLCGRAKDTIVLSSGKNVEPQGVEDAVTASPLIKHALLLGQDKRELGLLVWPDEEALKGVPEGALAPAQLQERLFAEVTSLNAARADYHPEEHIAHITLLRTPLSPEDGTLTRTLKPRRPEIMKRYGGPAGELLRRLRG